MKKTMCAKGVYTLKICVVIVWSGLSLAEEPLRFAQIENTPDQAVGAEILTLAYQKLNIPVEFILLPGKRALTESSEGRADGEVHRIFEIGTDYPALLRVPTPINYIEPSVFSKTENFVVTDCAALSAYRIGIVRGVKHSELCTDGMPSVIIGNDLNTLIRTLDSGRIDLLITARINGLVQIKKFGQNAIHPLSPPLSRMLVYHYLNETHRDLVPKIDRIFQEMQASGELEAVRERALRHVIDQTVAKP